MLASLTRIFRCIRCKLGYHKHLDVIQTFGTAQRIGCPDCGAQFGIHHGERILIPWDADLAAMYRNMGHDLDAPIKRWHAYRRTRLHCAGVKVRVG